MFFHPPGPGWKNTAHTEHRVEEFHYRDLSGTEVKKVRGSGKLTTHIEYMMLLDLKIYLVRCFYEQVKSLYNEVSYEKQEMNSVMPKVDCNGGIYTNIWVTNVEVVIV